MPPICVQYEDGGDHAMTRETVPPPPPPSSSSYPSLGSNTGYAAQPAKGTPTQGAPVDPAVLQMGPSAANTASAAPTAKAGPQDDNSPAAGAGGAPANGGQLPPGMMGPGMTPQVNMMQPGPGGWQGNGMPNQAPAVGNEAMPMPATPHMMHQQMMMMQMAIRELQNENGTKTVQIERLEAEKKAHFMNMSVTDELKKLMLDKENLERETRALDNYRHNLKQEIHMLEMMRMHMRMHSGPMDKSSGTPDTGMMNPMGMGGMPMDMSGMPMNPMMQHQMMMMQQMGQQMPNQQMQGQHMQMQGQQMPQHHQMSQQQTPQQTQQQPPQQTQQQPAAGGAPPAPEATPAADTAPVLAADTPPVAESVAPEQPAPPPAAPATAAAAVAKAPVAPASQPNGEPAHPLQAAPQPAVQAIQTKPKVGEAEAMHQLKRQLLDLKKKTQHHEFFDLDKMTIKQLEDTIKRVQEANGIKIGDSSEKQRRGRSNPTVSDAKPGEEWEVVPPTKKGANKVQTNDLKQVLTPSHPDRNRTMGNILHGLYMYTEFLSHSEENQLLKFVDDHVSKGQRKELTGSTFHKAKHMSAQLHYGVFYNMADNAPGKDKTVMDMPEELNKFVTKLITEGILKQNQRPNTAVISVMEDGDGMLPRVDSKEFSRPICTLAIQNDTDMLFGDRSGQIEGNGINNMEGYTLNFKRRSVILMDDLVANDVQHAVKVGKAKRILITFRQQNQRRSR